MAQSKSVIVFRGQYGNVSKSAVTGVLGGTELGILKTFMENHSNSVVGATSFSERTVYSVAVPDGSNTDRRASMYFQEVATGNTVRLTIPDPKSTDVELVEGRDGGERVKEATLELARAALATATGKTFRALYGVVTQKK